jgi:hypothetical protein
MTLVYVCGLFMIGRNAISLAFKIKDLATKEKRTAFNESKSQYFIYAALILTAVAGVVSGIGLLFGSLIFGYYMFYVVSGMMIYSYISYAGKTYENKNWIMFTVSIIVTILIIILVSLLALTMATGQIY